MSDRFGHRVDVTGRSRHRLRQHLAVTIENAGGQIAGLPDAGAERGSHQRFRLLLDDRDQPVPHDLVVDFGYRFHDRSLPPAVSLQPERRLT